MKKTKTIPDRELLQMILRGDIRANKITSRDPIIVVRGRSLVASLVPGKRNPRYRVEICRPKIGKERCRRKRTIVRSKIVWMIRNKKTVPKFHELHHKDDDRYNDSALNVVDWTEERHKDYHYGQDAEVPF